MVRYKSKTPHLFVWGLFFLLVTVFTLTSCGNNLSVWNNDGYKVTYDASVFSVVSSDSEVLNLETADDDGLIYVSISGFHPFALEQGKTDYFDAAQVAFQDEFIKITNNTKEENLQYGVHDRRVSVSGRHIDHDGVAMGLLRVMISDETLLHINIIGSSKTMMNYMNEVQEILNNAEILK